MGKSVLKNSKLGSLLVAYILSTTPLNRAATALKKLKKGPKLKSAWTLLFF
jgi:hypothetical protein